MRRRILLASALAAFAAACSRRGGDQTETDAAEEADPAEAALKDAPNTREGDAFLARTAKDEGVVSLPSGLMYKVVRSGPASGVHPRPQDQVRVHYEGTLIDGTVFDSSYAEGVPVVFRLGRLIPGWIEGIGLMRPGDEWILYVPAKLGYGREGAGGRIPPGSVLIFRIELLGVLQLGGPAMG
jgi:peptidylprolyl isomerase/FKBP-type peptidyl-prolyl cis-trans isomerase FklB